MQPPLSQRHHRAFQLHKTTFSWETSASLSCVSVLSHQKNSDSETEMSGMGAWPAVEYFSPSRVEKSFVQHINHYVRVCGRVDMEKSKALDAFYIWGLKLRKCSSLPHINIVVHLNPWISRYLSAVGSWQMRQR